MSDLSRIIHSLHEHDTCHLPGGPVATAGDLAYLLREILTLGCNVEHYLFDSPGVTAEKNALAKLAVAARLDRDAQLARTQRYRQ